MTTVQTLCVRRRCRCRRLARSVERLVEVRRLGSLTMSHTPSPWERPVFIASMGRSGSTLLQRVLNVHPQLTIWGEHGGMLSGLTASIDAVNQPAAFNNLDEGYEHREMVIGELSQKDVFKPWVSAFRPAGYEAKIRTMLTDLFTEGLSPDTRWGFKEIRYNADDVRKIMALFPHAHIVVLARDVNGYAQSRFFAWSNTDYDLTTDEGVAAIQQRLTKFINGWLRRYEGLVEVCNDFPERTSMVSYADLSAESGRVESLFGELGMTAPPSDAIEPVLRAVVGSSFKHNSLARSNRAHVGKIVDEIVAGWAEVDAVSTALSLK